MVEGTLTRRGKVVYRTHRSKRDRVKHTMRLSDIVRMVPKVYEDLDPTYFLNETEYAKMSGGNAELEKLFFVFEKTSDLLQMIYVDAPGWLKLQMMTRLLLNNIIRKIGGTVNASEEG